MTLRHRDAPPTATLARRIEDAGLNASAPPQQAFVDGCGRQRLFRGINKVTKTPPYAPPTAAFAPGDSLTPGDAALQQSLGFNGLRLGLLWAGAAPARKDAVRARRSGSTPPAGGRRVEGAGCPHVQALDVIVDQRRGSRGGRRAGRAAAGAARAGWAGRGRSLR
jgi:hypothetical protein